MTALNDDTVVAAGGDYVFPYLRGTKLRPICPRNLDTVLMTPLDFILE